MTDRVLIDIHTHAPPADAGVEALLCVDPGGLPAGASRVCMAVHPWDSAQPDAGDQLEHVRRTAEAGLLLAIGETGLDRACGIPLDAQWKLFERQLDIAEAIGLPVIIHAVRTYSDLLAVRAKRRRPTPWIVHGYTGDREMALRLADAGCFLSFGTVILKRHSKHLTALTAVPDAALFLESDMAPEHLADVYETAAGARGCTVDALLRLIRDNAVRLWGEDVW
jgi:TatD DNase family protein